MSVRPIEKPCKKTGKLKKGYFVDVALTLPDGSTRRKQRQLMGVTKRDAEKVEAQLKSLLINGDSQRKEKKKDVPTLDEFQDTFMKNHVAIRCRPKEQRNKEGHFRLHLLPHFGGKPMDQINARDIDDYIAAKRGTLAAKTINEHLSTLNLALKLAKKYGHIEHSPEIEWLPLEQKEREHLSFEDSEKLIHAADGEWRAMITTALKTGLRMSELLALRWENVDFKTRYISVKRSHVEGTEGPPKNGKIRHIAMGDDVFNALTAHRHERSDLVFCREDGTHLSKNQARRAIQRACKRAGLDATSWHPLRHSYASHLGQRNAPFKFIQESMGHSTAEMTAHYMHLDDGAKREAAKLVDHRDA